MSFLDKLSKGVGRAAEQAKFEADKLVRVNRLNSDVEELVSQSEQATAAIGTRVMELQRTGALQVPDLDEAIRRVETLKGQLSAKRTELEAAKVETFEGVPATDAEAQPASGFCPNCGASIQTGAKFCASCGHKLC